MRMWRFHPLRILFLASDPSSSDRLALDREAREIEEKILRTRHGHDIDFRTRWAVRAGDLQQAFLDLDPGVVHFSGHGTGSTGIVLHGEDGASEARVSAQALADLFRLFNETVRLVVLNACFSKQQAALIVEEIDFVVGMTDLVEDEAAKVFSAALYRGLASRKSIRAAFEMGRVELGLRGFEESRDVPRLLVRPGADADRSFLMDADDATAVESEKTGRGPGRDPALAPAEIRLEINAAERRTTLRVGDEEPVEGVWSEAALGRALARFRESRRPAVGLVRRGGEQLAPLMLTVLLSGLVVQVAETILKIQILFSGHRLLIGTTLWIATLLVTWKGLRREKPSAT